MQKRELHFYLLTPLLYYFFFSDIMFSAPSRVPTPTNGALSENKGRLMIYHAGEWGTVCGTFSTEDANVVCRQMGYEIDVP